jgi:hypothetical protein
VLVPQYIEHVPKVLRQALRNYLVEYIQQTSDIPPDINGTQLRKWEDTMRVAMQAPFRAHQRGEAVAVSGALLAARDSAPGGVARHTRYEPAQQHEALGNRVGLRIGGDLMPRAHRTKLVRHHRWINTSALPAQLVHCVLRFVIELA